MNEWISDSLVGATLPSATTKLVWSPTHLRFLPCLNQYCLCRCKLKYLPLDSLLCVIIQSRRRIYFLPSNKRSPGKKWGPLNGWDPQRRTRGFINQPHKMCSPICGRRGTEIKNEEDQFSRNQGPKYDSRSEVNFWLQMPIYSHPLIRQYKKKTVLLYHSLLHLIFLRWPRKENNKI